MHVAITGATGFLGLHLVQELLDQPHQLTVLAHAGSRSALERIAAFLGRPVSAGRVRVVEIELAHPRLGLTEPAFAELAQGLDAIWHCAADTTLDGDPETLHAVNVEGTRRVLELAAAGPRRPMVYHVSTAFVAGARRTGVSYEDELDDSSGFENAYEYSKYLAEVLVRDWSAAHSRPVIVLRPSILVTDRPPGPELPAHPLRYLAQLIESNLLRFGLTGIPKPYATLPAQLRPVVRVSGSVPAHLNLLPVDLAARTMLRLAAQPPSGGVDTYHVVHGRDVEIPVIKRLIEALAPMRIEFIPDQPVDPSPMESVAGSLPGFLPYLHHRRRFDDSRASAVLGPSGDAVRVDLEYLLRGTQTPVRAAAPVLLSIAR